MSGTAFHECLHEHDLGVRVIGIDRPGFGMSTYVKGYRIADWPADVIEFANALGLKRFAVAGISSGSPYALACARFTAVE